MIQNNIKVMIELFVRMVGA